VEGEVPGYPAAAVRPFNSSCKIEEKLTASRPRYGQLMTLSGLGLKERVDRTHRDQQSLAAGSPLALGFREYLRLLGNSNSR
jgi:hypothetical protein